MLNAVNKLCKAPPIGLLFLDEDSHIETGRNTFAPQRHVNDCIPALGLTYHKHLCSSRALFFYPNWLQTWITEADHLTWHYIYIVLWFIPVQIFCQIQSCLALWTIRQPDHLMIDTLASQCHACINIRRILWILHKISFI